MSQREFNNCPFYNIFGIFDKNFYQKNGKGISAFSLKLLWRAGSSVDPCVLYVRAS